MGRIGDKLAELGLELPAPPAAPPGVVLPFKWVKVSGSYAYISGHGPLDGGDVLVRGKVGADVSPERGYEAARLTALSIFASLQEELGDLDRVTGWVKALGLVNCAPGFSGTPGRDQRVQRAGDRAVGGRRAPRALGDRGGGAAVRDVSGSRGNRGGVMTLETTAPDLFARYLDDLEVGDSFTTKGRTVTEADIVNFAALTWDTYPLHVDAEWASKTIFGERIAHGMLVLSFAAGLVPMQPGPIVAFYGMEKVRFFAPDQDRRHDPRARRAEGEGGARRHDGPRHVPPAGAEPARRDGLQVDHQGAAEATSGRLDGARRAEPADQAAARRAARARPSCCTRWSARYMDSPPEFMAMTGGQARRRCAQALFDSQERLIKLPIVAFLVEHPGVGPIIIDTGFHPSVATDPKQNLGRVLGRLYNIDMRPEQAISAQLREQKGIDPSDVRVAIMTHLHMDHASAISEFTSATYVLGRGRVARVPLRRASR